MACVWWDVKPYSTQLWSVRAAGAEVNNSLLNLTNEVRGECPITLFPAFQSLFCFSVAALRAWNRLPTELKLLRSTDSLLHDLKTFLFDSVYGHQGTD